MEQLWTDRAVYLCAPSWNDPQASLRTLYTHIVIRMPYIGKKASILSKRMTGAFVDELKREKERERALVRNDNTCLHTCTSLYMYMYCTLMDISIRLLIYKLMVYRHFFFSIDCSI